MATIESLRKQAQDLRCQYSLVPYAEVDEQAASELEALQKEVERLNKFHIEDMRVTNESADYHMKQCAVLRTQNQELKEALEVARCPNCDGSGAVQRGERTYVSRDMAMDAGCPEMEGSIYTEPEIEQCQWCDLRNKALALKP